MMFSRMGMLIASLALLTGCAATVVRAPEPVAPPTAWSARFDTAAAAAVPVAAWWEELADDQLNRLVELALRNGAVVSVAAARVLQARAFAKEAGANRSPQVDVGVAGLQRRIPETSLRDGEGGKQTIPAYRQSNLVARLDARYEIDLLGRLALGERAAAAESAASDEELRAVRQWLAREVVLAYADLRLIDERAALSHEAGVRLGELMRTQQDRLRAGLVGRERLREAERALAETSDARAALAHERHATLARLANLLGLSMGELQVQVRTDFFARIALSGAVTPELPATVLERRADVAAAWQRVLAASDRAERARLERYPTLALTGSAGYVSETFRRWLTGDAMAWLLQATLQAPLFDGGRIEARAEQARGAVDELHARYRMLVVSALAEAETALSSTQTARERTAFAEAELVRRVADRAAAADLRSAGVGSRPELLQKEVEELAAAESLSVRRHDLLLAWANTQKALGR
jgi:NodT family efflux transporter outer membrane factor (OMF) lipoprotein